MKLTIAQAAKTAGVSERTLRHYHNIGLLVAPRRENGYREYDEALLRRLWQIRYLQELGFALCQIGSMLDDPSFDQSLALRRKRQLLLAQRDRLEQSIGEISRLLGEEEPSMQKQESYEELRDRYAAEAKERWGDTPQWIQSQQRERQRTPEQNELLKQEADSIFTAFAALRGTDPAADTVQALVARWQTHISNHYYDCPKPMLENLGLMYTADERFTRNLDAFGQGTAQLMSDAIAIYCAT